MYVAKDLTGLRFGRLVVLERAGSARGYSRWKCLCDCGGITYAISSNLKGGHVKSCGCYADYIRKTAPVRHGEAHTRLYTVWNSMKMRCLNPNNRSYHNYGGRGIKVCEEWMKYEPFRDWALAHGYNATASYGKVTLDRIDVNGDYCPQNCRLVDIKAQSNNKRNNVYIEINGETKTMKQWAEFYGIPYKLVLNRHFRGLSVEQLFYKGDMRLKGERDAVPLGRA